MSDPASPGSGTQWRGATKLFDPLDFGPALVLSPIGRDADVIARMLGDLGLCARACGDLGEVCRVMGEEAPMLILAEEGLAEDLAPLIRRLDDQPAWSDLPLLVLSAAGMRRGVDARWRLFERLGNAIVLDRPLHVGAFQGAVRAAIRSRSRQYQARAHLEQIEAARRELESRVAERTRQLRDEMTERHKAEVALARSQRLEAIGQLTGGVAHDFNNLLQVIIAGVSRLERSGADPLRRSAVLGAMRQAGERGAKLTSQLLAFARRQPLTPEPVDVADRVQEMRELLRNSVRPDLKLEISLGADLWPIMADPTQLEVAILNLVVNARDATQGAGSITLAAENMRLRADADPDGLAGDFVRICVRDTGAGMDEDTLQRAVEPFFTTKNFGLGTGLGLSQVHGFVSQSGGGLHIDSAPGRGTSVSLLLPRGRQPPRDDSPAARAAPLPGFGRILVVEDEQRIAELACDLLRDMGFECEHAPDAERALSVDLTNYTAVFTDVAMPGRLDGIGLARELRRRRPELPILLTSGFAGAPERIAEAGFPVLSKPYDFDGLGVALSALLGRSG